NSYAERLIGSIRRECLDHIPCTQRIIAAPESQIVFLLLPAGAHPSGLGQGHASTASDSTARTGQGGRHPGSGRTPSGVRAESRLERHSLQTMLSVIPSLSAVVVS